MKRVILTGCMAMAALSAARAQAPGVPEQLSAWPYVKEVRLPAVKAGLFDLVLDRDILENANPGQADLRVYSASGREIPYALRVRREVENTNLAACREFNRGVEGGAAAISCDLGERPPEHNVIEVSTGGNNFRRMATVEGSGDGAEWAMLASQAILFRFSAAGRTVEQAAVSYPTSRYRYLRVRVARDPQVDAAAPEITGVRVRFSVHAMGEMASFPAVSFVRDADRSAGRPASVWRIDLGARIPVERLVLDGAGAEFSRPFQLEIVDDPAAPQYIAGGELTRHAENTGQTLTIAFGERMARHLNLTVTDDRNPPLRLAGITAMSAARQVIFEAAAAGAGPVRVYYGNRRALEPRYDFGMRIPANPAAVRTQLGDSVQWENPAYRPEPKPFSERWPWVIYLLLTGACLALAAILVNLARAAKAQPQE